MTRQPGLASKIHEADGVGQAAIGRAGQLTRFGSVGGCSASGSAGADGPGCPPATIEASSSSERSLARRGVAAITVLVCGGTKATIEQSVGRQGASRRARPPVGHHLDKHLDRQRTIDPREFNDALVLPWPAARIAAHAFRKWSPASSHWLILRCKQPRFPRVYHANRLDPTAPRTFTSQSLLSDYFGAGTSLF
jgi:hypothetical protein